MGWVKVIMESGLNPGLKDATSLTAIGPAEGSGTLAVDQTL